MARARVHVAENLDNLLRKDWVNIIEQANLGKTDTCIAEMYLLDAVPQVDIGVEVGLERSTVSRRLNKYILPRIEKTARKMGII